MSIVSKGFYVHYKGGIYFVQNVVRFVQNVIRDPKNDEVVHESAQWVVIYESVQGCGDDVSALDDTEDQRRLEVDAGDIGCRHRKLSEFVEEVDWTTGLTDMEALQKGIVNHGQMIPRFQRVVGWRGGRPLVLRNDKDTDVVPFSPQYGPHYEEDK